MIVMEHLISESNSPDKKYTLVGDGDYEGLKWINGKWVHVSKIFNEVTPEGGAQSVPQSSLYNIRIKPSVKRNYRAKMKQNNQKRNPDPYMRL